MRKRILVLMGLMGTLSLCSCKLQREDPFELNTTEHDASVEHGEETTEEQILTAQVLRVDIPEDREPYDTENVLIEMILGMTYEEAQEHGTDGKCSYETDTFFTLECWHCYVMHHFFIRLRLMLP